MVSSVAKPRGESSRFGGSPHFSVTGMLQDVRPRRDRHWAATSAAPPAEGSPLGLWIFPPPRWRRSQSVIAAGTTWRERPRLSRPGWGEPSTGAAALVAAGVGRALRASRAGGLGRDKRGPSRFPDFPELPDFPEFPEVPELPGFPDFPEFPEVPELPDFPDLPDYPAATPPARASFAFSTATSAFSAAFSASSAARRLR